MKKTRSFSRRLLQQAWHYKLLTIASLALTIGLVLQLSGAETAAHWLLGIVSIIETGPLLQDMWRTVRSGGYGIDILAVTAIVSSVILGQYWAAIVVVLMLTGGESLEDYAQHRARRELDSLLAHAPQIAHVLRKNKVSDVPVDQLKVGDKIIIKAGELVPVDASIIEGSASFDEASLTGESLPQPKNVGDQLLSGSINIDGAITAKALATAADSQYQQIIKLVQGAAASQAPFVRLADRYSIPFTFVAYAIAVSVWALSGHAIRFLEVIVVATPCPLLLAAPIALISGMSLSSRYGIIVKTGGALERLAEAQTIAFDKTGTLTSGQLTVDKIQAFGAFKNDDVLALAAALEQNSVHVLALAIVDAAKRRKLKLVKAKSIQETAGKGLRADIRGRQLLVGRYSFLQDEGVTTPHSFKQSDINQTAVYVASDGALAGVITFKDELRPEAKSTLRKLRDAGLRHMLMITGDNQVAARRIGKQLGIDHVHAEAFPADKLHILEEVQERPLVFVGDGVNDAPVLTGADVGIALGARGSTAASESADMVIMLDDLGRVATAYEIARGTFRIARQSILVGIGLSVGLMVIFASGKFSPLAGAIIQEVVDVVVIINALRAHQQRLETI